MCGIFGYVGNVSDDKRDKFYELLEALFNASEARGTHASGFAARWDTGEMVVDKLPYRGSVFTMLSRSFRALGRGQLPTSLIAHTRLGTGSAPRLNNNNHPFEGDKFVMVHNGTIPGWSERAATLKMLPSFSSETDSEIIIRLIDERKDKDKSTEDSIEWILNNLWGNMAVALLERDEPNIWLFRNENPLSVFTVDKNVFGETIIFFCSTWAIFDNAWHTVFKHSCNKNVTCTTLTTNKAFLITNKPHIINKKPCRFIVHETKVNRAFYKSTGYNGHHDSVWTESYRDTKLDEGSKDFSMIAIDPTKPELGLSMEKTMVEEIRTRIANKKAVTLIDGILFENNAIISSFVGRMTVLDKIGAS